MAQKKINNKKKSKLQINNLNLILFTESIASILECGLAWNEALQSSLVFLDSQHTEKYFKNISFEDPGFSKTVIRWCNDCQNYDLSAVLRILMLATITGGPVATQLRQYANWIRDRQKNRSRNKIKFENISDYFHADFQTSNLAEIAKVGKKNKLQKHSLIVLIYLINTAISAGLNAQQSLFYCSFLGDNVFKSSFSYALAYFRMGHTIEETLDILNQEFKDQELVPITHTFKIVNKYGASPVDLLSSYRLYLEAGW